MNVVAIGAHADDLELGMGGTIAKHVAAGDNVCMVLVTHSGYSSYKGVVVREQATAFKEAQQAADILGVTDLRCLGHETKYVTYSADLIEQLNQIIDDVGAGIVYTHWDGDLNQDHSAISKSTLVAARNIPRVLMYRSNWYKSVKPFDGSFYVDISQNINDKINSIKAHHSECQKNGEKWVEFFKHQTRGFGIEIGVEYAELFKVIKWRA